ncbi:hypothetical protein CBS147323_5396 [Aspergillus niger]|nr:hypothetical protein CBS12448_8157 [Aspergillus niger]KAI2940033.1 hypothetical protein CBS147322_9923 [Aspergillus niger]KAI2966503.1 hypothetical protein CBS147323_5396 [Aspergillus niger]KAI3018883.1 hypothetical protein CBS147347_9433 [Aspergillus niger]KAI3084628.1 hypothetical protein CBS147353_1761 [Aspergillus niger]
MNFWIGWALWQKLSFALAGLLALVLVYSFIVLAYNRRKTMKYATAEARQKAEMQPMLAEPSDIPFGARALEKGIQVEGIWTPDCHSARQSTTHSGSRPGSTASAPRPMLMTLTGDDIQGLERTYQPAPSPSIYDQCSSPKVLDIEHGQSEQASLKVVWCAKLVGQEALRQLQKKINTRGASPHFIGKFQKENQPTHRREYPDKLG